MKPFAVQRYCSLSYSRLSTHRSPLTRGNIKLLCATPIHRASFVNDSSSEGAKSLSTCMHPSSRISEVLDGTMKIAQSSRNINKALGNGTERQKRSDSISKPRSQGELKADMDLLFCNRNICDKVLFDKFMRESFKDCKIRNISNFMRLAGKKSRSKSTYYLKKHLPYIASRLQSSIHSSWRYLDISFVIYGLQCLDENDRSYLDILSTMTKIVSITQKSEDIMEARFLSIMLYGLQRNTGNGRINGRLLAVISQIAARCIDTFDSQNVGNALYGLQGMSSEIAEVRELISALALKVKECTTHLNAQEVGNALYGLKGMGSGSVEVCALISALAPKVKGCSVAFDDQAVGNALYGLQGMSSDSAEVRELISALVPKIRESTAHLSAQAVGNALYGLQGMSSDSAEVRALISALAPKIRECTAHLSAQEVSNSLYGLQGMSSDSAEVRELISALATKVKGCSVAFDAQTVGNALYGLQGMSSDSAEVRALISVLALKVKECTAHLSAQEVGNAFYGLQGMSSDNAEVRALISALVPKVKGCSVAFDAQTVGNALYGLQGMSSDSAEVRELISALVPKIRESTAHLSAQAVGNALYGLQGMSSDSAEVRELISALALKIRECTAHLSAQAVGNALYGLQGMSSEIAEVRELISALAPKIRECTAHLSAQEVGNALYGICCLVGSLELDLAVDAIWGNIVHLGLNTSNIKTLSDFDIMCLGQSIVLCLPVLQGSLKEDDYRKWESVSVLIGTELSSRFSKARDSMSFQSNVERRMHAVLTRIFDKSDIMITHNEYLFNLFEADMVLRIPTISGDNFLINIEVDGIHHLREKSKRFCALRDEYLKSKGVVVSRIEVSALHDMSDKDVESWALDRLTNAVFEFEGL